MGRLIYGMNVSLDGYIETAERTLDWSVRDEELLAWFAERASRLAATLYGRRLYELMSAHWPTADTDPAATEATLEYRRVWLRNPKIVFSSTLTSVDHNSRLIQGGDVGEHLARLRAEFDGDFEVAGPTLASAFIERELVDTYHLIVHPVILGSGTPFFPPQAPRQRLRLYESRVFPTGVTYLAYEVIRE